MPEDRMDRLESDLSECARIVKILAETALEHEGRIGGAEDRMVVIDQKIEILIDSQMRVEGQIEALSERQQETDQMLRRFLEGLGRNGG
jgi:hypothetical protein